MTRPRVVFDTNVLLSLYVFADSRFAALRVGIEAGTWCALSREDCLEEFRRVLAYPLFSLSGVQQELAFNSYRARVTCIDSSIGCHAAYELPRCSDRDDQKFLEVARDGHAQYLVTSDKALLKLARRARQQGLFSILTPDVALREFALATPPDHLFKDSLRACTISLSIMPRRSS